MTGPTRGRARRRMLALLPSALVFGILLTASSAARADEPGSGRVSGAGTSKMSPRWPLASLASAARADEPGSGRVSGAGTSKMSPRWPLASLASAAAADRLDEIKVRGSLILGTCYTTPPYCFREPGQSNIKGYDLDIVARVAAHLGVGIDVVLVESGTQIPLLTEAKVDMVASSMTRTPERARAVEFSIPYFFGPQGIVVKKASGIAVARQLAGRKIAAVKGSAVGAAVEEAVPRAQIVYFGNYAQCFNAFRDGAVDAFATDTLVLRAYVASQKDADEFHFIPDFEKRRAAGFAMKKGEVGLRDAVNRALLGLEASGEAASIYDAWFGPKSEHPLPRSFRIQRE